MRKLLTTLCCCPCSLCTAPFGAPSPGHTDATVASSSARPSEGRLVEIKQSVRLRYPGNSKVHTISSSHSEAPTLMVYSVFHVPVILSPFSNNSTARALTEQESMFQPILLRWTDISKQLVIFMLLKHQKGFFIQFRFHIKLVIAWACLGS